MKQAMTTETWVKMRERRARQLAEDRIQAEVMLARQISEQHSDISRDDALRAAARIVERDPKFR